MKICYLSDANSIHTKKWCKFFKTKGYDIHVISLNDGEIDGVTVHSLKIQLDNVRNGSFMNKIQYLTYTGKVKALVNEIKSDILHAHYATSYAFLAGATNFHPYVISVWGSDVYDFPKQNILCRKFVERNLSKADVLLSTSKVMAEETKKYTNKSIEITPFGVDINLFKPNENKYDNREEIVIGTIKALEAKYGIEYLVRAFGNLAKKYDNIYLEIGGIGSQKEYLDNLCKKLNIESRVEFLGFITPEEVVQSFNRFDIAVFPSTLDSESFGVAAVEAQACGTPTIVSNVGGLPEATCPGKSSIVIPKEDTIALEKAIEKLITDEELRISMGKYGRQFVVNNYNVKDNFNKVEVIYKELLNSQHK